MRKKILLIWMLILLSALGLAGCSGIAYALPESQVLPAEKPSTASQPAAAVDAAAEPPASVPLLAQPVARLSQSGAEGVIVNGNLVPGQSVDLSFNTSGKVSEVLVAEGDMVTEGQVLARLRTTDSTAALEHEIAEANSAVAEANTVILRAMQELETLKNSAESATAQAQLDLANAQVAYDEAVSKKESAQTNRANETAQATAEAELLLAQSAFDKAQANFNEVANKPATNKQRAQRLVELTRAQERLTAAILSVDWYSSSVPASELAVLDANVSIAKANLDEATATYELLKDGPDPAQLELKQAGIDQADAELKAAKARLAAAKAALDDTEMRAPIAGKVATSRLKAGEVALPGKSMLTLADFSYWYVETEDLSELDVVNIVIGQPVIITPESLPDVHIMGVVKSISDTFSKDSSGKVLYTVRIRVDKIDPRMRWGMTMTITFGK